MANLSSLERAWNAAQPRLSAIKESLKSPISFVPRIFRVGQLDSELLDQELVQLLREPLNKALTLIDASLNARFEPELTLLIQLTLYKLSIWNAGASYGAKLQDLKYTVSSPESRTLSPSGLPRHVLIIHGALSTILPYFHTKIRSHALSSAWPDAPALDRRRKAWELLVMLESSYTLISLANFVAFLWNGRFRSIVDRLLGMSLTPSRRQVRREVSYEFMNRQMVWHAFTEFLIFLLPLLRTRTFRRRVNRIINMLSPSNCLLSLGVASVKSKERQSEKGKYWSLPQDQCAICAENASFNLNPSDNSNAFSSRMPAVADSVSDPAIEAESELPAFPIYNPYITNCGDVYCYHCIAERMMQTTDATESQAGWECLRCRMLVTNSARYKMEVESDGSGSDYDFSSDISVSMGSFSESGWSDSSMMD